MTGYGSAHPPSAQHFVQRGGDGLLKISTFGEHTIEKHLNRPTMKTHTYTTLALALLFNACGSSDKTPEERMEEALESNSLTTSFEIGDCDPIIKDYDDLMADYVEGLQSMVDNQELDQEWMDELKEKGDKLEAEVKAKGAEEVGEDCWREFNGLALKYQPEITRLGMEITKMQMQKNGMDPAMLEKYMQQSPNQ